MPVTSLQASNGFRVQDVGKENDKTLSIGTEWINHQIITKFTDDFSGKPWTENNNKNWW